MSKLASLAGTKKLSGAVCITDKRGVTHEYATEEEAAQAWEGKLDTLAHERGAFYARKPAPKPAPVAVAEEEAPRKRSERRKRSD